MFDEMAFNVVGGALLLGIWRTHAHLVRAILPKKAAQPRSVRRPSVTIIRPIRGLDAGAEANIAAAFDNDYEGDVELLFTFDDASEPAIPLVQAEIARRRSEGNRASARILYAGAPPPGRTGKLNAMIVAEREARGELLAVCDSDTRPGPGALASLVDALLGTPRAGSAFAPVVVPGPAKTAGDVGYALMLNALYGPEAASAAAADGELPFIMGQFMVFRRDALAAIGGLSAVSGQLVDDMYIGVLLAKAGYRNVVAPYRLPIIQYSMGLGEFARTYRRWIIFSRSGLPSWEFKWPAWLRGIEFWVALLMVVGAVLTRHPLGAVLPAIAVGLACYSIAELQRLFGGSPIEKRHLWVPFAVLACAPPVYLSIFLRPAVNWRGRAYTLDSNARLAPVSAKPPAAEGDRAAA
jgi:ceramide glucosyltransferase